MASQLHLTIYTSELLADLRAEGWRASDVLPGSAGHARHQWADICEPGNLQTVARALLLAWAEASAHPLLRGPLPAGAQGAENEEAPAGHDDRLRLPDKFVCLARIPEQAGMPVLLRLHDFLVSAALCAFAETLPGADATLWRRRRAESLAALQAILASPPSEEDPQGSGLYAFRRPVPMI